MKQTFPKSGFDTSNPRRRYAEPALFTITPANRAAVHGFTAKLDFIGGEADKLILRSNGNLTLSEVLDFWKNKEVKNTYWGYRSAGSSSSDPHTVTVTCTTEDVASQYRAALKTLRAAMEKIMQQAVSTTSPDAAASGYLEIEFDGPVVYRIPYDATKAVKEAAEYTNTSIDDLQKIADGILDAKDPSASQNPDPEGNPGNSGNTIGATPAAEDRQNSSGKAAPWKFIIAVAVIIAFVVVLFKNDRKWTR